MTDNPNHGHARRSPQGGLNWSQQLRDRLLAVKVADLCDGLHTLRRPVRLAESSLRPVMPFSQVAGPAVTVRTFIGSGKRDYDEQAAELYESGRSCQGPVMGCVARCPSLPIWGAAVPEWRGRTAIRASFLMGRHATATNCETWGFPFFNRHLSRLHRDRRSARRVVDS